MCLSEHPGAGCKAPYNVEAGNQSIQGCNTERLVLIPGVSLRQVFTSDHALKLEWVPNWVAIIGSGYIGLEFSDVYTALGSEVTFIEVC